MPETATLIGKDSCKIAYLSIAIAEQGWGKETGDCNYLPCILWVGWFGCCDTKGYFVYRVCSKNVQKCICITLHTTWHMLSNCHCINSLGSVWKKSAFSLVEVLMCPEKKRSEIYECQKTNALGGALQCGSSQNQRPLTLYVTSCHTANNAYGLEVELLTFSLVTVFKLVSFSCWSQVGWSEYIYCLW